MRSIAIVICCCALWVLLESAAAQESDQFESLLASAQAAQARSDFQSSAQFYLQAVHLHPEIAELQANLGLMLYQVGKTEQARESFRQALRLKPQLFVPNLFLGLGYVKDKRFREALPYLREAALSHPDDVKATLALGQAYSGLGKSRLAIAINRRMVERNPQNADGWFQLGVSYLGQVEDNARTLLARHHDSGYLHALVANNFAEERAYIQAAQAYEKALASPAFPPGTHAAYGFVLLNQHNLAAAEHELNIELASHSDSLMAKLGIARLKVEQGAESEGAKQLVAIGESNPTFLRVNAPLFMAGLSESQLSVMRRAIENARANGEISQAVTSLFQDGNAVSTGAEESYAAGFADKQAVPPVTQTKEPTRGTSGECKQLLAAQFRPLELGKLRTLVSCAYTNAAYETVFSTAQKLLVNSSTETEGLYWETRSAQKLASDALARASELNSDSPVLHVLLGDIYRQRKNFPDAENEYRKALALNPEDNGAMFGLSLTLHADGKIQEAREIAIASLKKNPDDPEFNAVMGEILSAQHDFANAEPYLKKALKTKPELIPHVHALLARVYSETGRSEQAITEFKLGLSDDKDGRIHFQMGRVYLKLGDRESANKAFEISDQLRREGLTRAEVALQQSETSEFQ